MSVKAVNPSVYKKMPGQPDYAIKGGSALAGPAELPPAHVKRFHSAILATFATREVREAVARQGNVIKPSTPEAAAF